MTSEAPPADNNDRESSGDARKKTKLRHRIKTLCNATKADYTVAVFAFIVMFALNWFVVEKYFSTPSASVTRATALVGSSAYQSKGREQIAVVELNDAYLQWLGASWPPSYTLYRNIFEDIAQYQPQSIFLDIALVHSRSDSGVHALIDTLCRISASGTRIYLAALPDHQGHLHLRPEFMSHSHPKPPQPPCFELVDVRYTPDEATYLTTNYPLMDKGQTSLAQRNPSAAFAMARDVWLEQCLASKPHPDDEHAAAMLQKQCMKAIASRGLPNSISLTWGMGAHEEKRYRQWEHCNMQPTALLELIPLPLRKIWSTPTTPCPFHPHVPLRMISDPNSDTEYEELLHSIKGRHVMVGAVVNGINDAINAPIHGYIPGVYLHAMALDNLLTDYPNLKSSDDGQASMPWFFWLLACVLAIVCFLIYEILHGIFHLEPTCENCHPVPEQRSGWNAFVAEMGHFVRWASAKCVEIVLSLGLLWLVMRCLLNPYPYSAQTLAQVMAVVFGLQWTGVTAKVFKSAKKIFK